MYTCKTLVSRISAASGQRGFFFRSGGFMRAAAGVYIRRLICPNAYLQLFRDRTPSHDGSWASSRGATPRPFALSCALKHCGWCCWVEIEV